MASTYLSIEELVTKVETNLNELGYSKKYRGNINRIYRQLLMYAESKGISQMTKSYGDTFALDLYGIDVRKQIPKRDIVVRSIQMLLDYQETGKFSVRRVIKRGFPNELSNIFEEYYLTTSFGKTTLSLKTYRNYLLNIAGFLEQCSITDISQVDERTILCFVHSLSGYSQPCANRHINVFSGLLNYVFSNGHHSKDLSKSCQKVRVFRDNHIPSILTQKEVQKLLNAIDRNTPIGKRDYALLLLVARTGLRTSDIMRLQFDNLRWDTSTIQIIQNKTGNMLVLPLLEDVGLAIIDYIKHARPKSDSNFIFIGTRAPFRSRMSSMNLIVKKYMVKAKLPNIDTRHPGLHILRHSLASSMLEKGASLTVISNVLGHSSSNTTKRYLKVDINKLRTCPLEVPYV